MANLVKKPARSVRIDFDCYQQLESLAKAERRSTAKQAEYLIEIGMAALENPDLPISFIKQMLIAEQSPIDAGFTLDL